LFLVGSLFVFRGTIVAPVATASPATVAVINISTGFDTLLRGTIVDNVHTRKVTAIVNGKKAQLMQVASDLEILVGITSIGLLFFGGSLLSIFVYWNVLRMKYTISIFTQNSFKKLDVVATRGISNPYCPPLLGKIYAYVKQFLSSCVAPSQREGSTGRTCSIQ